MTFVAAKSPSPAAGGRQAAVRDLVGVWRLESFRDVDDGGGPVGEGPLGPDPRGMLVYTADGHVSVSMMRTAPGPGPAFMGYAGRWSVDAGVVVHRIEISSRADWVDVEQTRDADLDGDLLTVRAVRTDDGGEPQRRVLNWRRVR